MPRDKRAREGRRMNWPTLQDLMTRYCELLFNEGLVPRRVAGRVGAEDASHNRGRTDEVSRSHEWL
jgi:hypothetical protein